MDKNKNYTALKKFCLDQGAGLFGVADIECIKKEFLLAPRLLEKMDKAVCLAASLSSAILEEIDQQPTRIYFHNYRTLNTLLDQIALKAANFIQNKGFLALPVPASQIIDWQKQTSHLSHKKIGHLAGLGWIGRNNLLVNKKLGSQLRLVTILTNLPLKIDQPTKDNCSTCRLCLTVCPAGAIKDNPADFDHLKCFEKLKEFQKQRIAEQFICGVCVKACRANIRC